MPDRALLAADCSAVVLSGWLSEVLPVRDYLLRAGAIARSVQGQ
ncbi:hypothetical protein QUA81_14345 [Microcoleus sp. F6_B4]